MTARLPVATRRLACAVPDWCRTAMLLACLLAARPASSYLIQTSEGAGGRFVQASWSRDTLPFWIDAAGSDDLGGEETARILRESFAVWEQVPSARVEFEDRGLSRDRAPAGRDGRNQVIFDETGEWLGAPRGSGIIAVTRLSTNTFDGRIHDADIIFNGRDHRFSAEPAANRVLLRDVAVHEIGHLLGLDHTPLAGEASRRPTMNPFYRGDGPGEAASLEADDVAGVSALFPTSSFLSQTGTLSGRVTTLAGEAVFGAVVTAEEVVTGDRYATLSGAETGPDDLGAYTLRGLLPGSYRLAIAPLPGSMDESNFGGAFTGLATDFPAEFHDNVERADLARRFDLAFPALHVRNLDFHTGFRVPDEPFIRVVDELANTPDVLGPYVPRFHVDSAESSELVVDMAGQQLVLPLQPRGDGLFDAAIPGQPAGTVVRYRVRAVSATGLVTEFPADGQWLSFDVLSLSGLPLAFAVLRDDAVLGVFDTGAMGEVARVGLGDDPIQVLTAHDGRHLYVSNLGSSEITVIETATFRVVDRIAVAAQPLDMALSADGRTLYVTNSGAASLTAIDVVSRQVVSRIAVGLLTDGPYGIVAGGDDRVYLTDLVTGAVLVVSGGTLSARIPVAGQPRSLALSADGGELFVTSFRSDALTFIDVATQVVTGTLSLPVSGTFAVALHPDGRHLYVTAHDDGVVVVVDTRSRSVADVLSVGTNPRGLSFSPAGDLLYVTSATSDEIFVLDAATHELRDTFRASGGPRGISVIESPAPDQPTQVADGAEPADHAGPLSWSLSQVYPNPFNPATAVRVTLPEPGTLTVVVYDALGRRVRQLGGDERGSGAHTLSWDGRDESGRAVSSGLYLFVADTPAGRLARKGLLLR